jgi:hypothetical protein
LGTENDDATANQTFFNHEAGVVVDPQGNIHYTWVAHDRQLYLSTSRDGGNTWSKPVTIGPPGARQAWNPAIDINRDGRIALVYMASTNAPGPPFTDGPEDPARYKDVTFNGYITVTDDAGAADPTFYTASVNAPADPLVKGQCPQVRCAQEFDFIDVVVAEDGTPWAVLADGCTAEKCISQGVGAGVVARLVPPPGGAPAAALPASPTCTDRRKFTFRLHHARRARVVRVEVFVNGRRKLLRRGSDIKRVTLRRLPRKSFRVRVVSTQSSGAKLISRRTYRGCTKTRPHTRGIHRQRGSRRTQR